MRFFVFILLLLTGYQVKAATLPSYVPISSSISKGKDISPDQHAFSIARLRAFANLTVKDYEKLTGKKMNFLQRFSFKASQRRVKMMLRHYESGDVTTLQKISWLLKGLLLGPIAVLLAYLLLQDEERELIKWAWFGFAGFSIILILILVAF